MASRKRPGIALGMGLALGLLLASTIAAAAPTPVVATALPPETDTAKALRLTRELEAAPDRVDGLETRRWLTQWVVQTPDYIVNVCDVLDLTSVPDDARSHGGELMVQLMFGNAAYQIENGTQADELSKQVAAAESVLRAYSAFVAIDAKARVPHLDAMIAQRDAGTLRAHVATVMESQCALGTGNRAVASAPSGPPFLGGFLRESHVVYPVKLDGWEMQGEQRFDTQHDGAAVRFLRAGDKKGWIDVFFYPAGVLSDAEVAHRAGVERQNLLQAWAKAMAGPQDMTALATFTVPTGKGADAGITAYALDFAMSHDGMPVSSAMVFAVDRMYAIKFRYSAEAPEFTRARVRQDLEQFARHMLAQLEISSTGDCASLPPAQRHPGCTGAEPVQPEVKDGMRELRFEYRASESEPVSRPLKIRRSGTT